jgi:Tol biopolymer transport system component
MMIKKHVRQLMYPFLLLAIILTINACSNRTPTPVSVVNTEVLVFKGGLGKLAFSALRSAKEQYEIYTMDLIDGNISQLTKNGFADIAPSWSPDGKKIVYSSNVNGNYALFSMNADGSAQTQIHLAKGVDETQPVWSPDGTKIAYQSNAFGDFDIFVLTLGSSTEALRLTTGDTQETQPSWSPDGLKIGFVSNSYINFDIYVMDLDGKNVTQLTKNRAYDSSPVWSPNGQQIAFISKRDPDQHFQLFVMNADGSNETQLTTGDFIVHSPAWSPDGKTIAFIGSDTDSSRVLAIDVASKEIFTITSGFYDYAGLSWVK